jgi:hypothetical protein
MSSGDPFYIPNIRVDDRKVLDALKYLLAMIDKISVAYELHIKYSTRTFKEIIHLFNREMNKLVADHPKKGPNIYKRTAAMATWILRLKPIYNVEFTDNNKMFPDAERKNFAQRHINEIFAIFYCICIIRKTRPQIVALPNIICNRVLPGMPEFDNFLANLRFRFLGVRQLATILRLCCENTLPSDD